MPDLPRVLVTRRLPAAARARLEGRCRLDYNDRGQELPRPDLLRRVRDCEGLLCLLTDRVDAALLAAAPRLRAVSTFSVGYDHIDVKACAARGVAVTNTPGVLTETVADFTWALLLSAARRVVEGDHWIRRGRYHGWDPMLLLGTDVHRKTLGLVGFGRIGQAVAKRARGFSMKVLYHDVHPAAQDVERECGALRVPLAELLASSDFVSVHAALDAGSRHLIGARELAGMKAGAFLINTSRGAVVDEKALVRALESGRLGGAALDVFEREPLLEPGLRQRPNALLQPHLASATEETRTRMAEMAADGLLDSLAGRRSAYLVEERAPAYA
jgi:glyoxylate reductase